MAEVRRDCPFCGTRFERKLDAGVGDVVYVENRATFQARYHGGSKTTTGSPRAAHQWQIYGYLCPRCGEHSADIVQVTQILVANRETGLKRGQEFEEVRPLIPWGTERPVPAEVPAPIAEDYLEATRIMGLSLKGATTMARRCLQRVIREAHPALPAQAKKRLVAEIDWVIANSNWDQDIKDTLHHLREAGNFGAHPGEDGLTEVYELQEDDLEGCLTLLEILFQQVYVEPARVKERLAKLRAQVPVRGKNAVPAPAVAPLSAPSTPPALNAPATNMPPASGSRPSNLNKIP